MIKKLIVICLIGLISIVSLPSTVGAYGWPSGGYLLADQTSASPQTTPVTQPDSAAQKDTARPAAPAVDRQSTKERTPAERSSVVKQKSRTEPFSPYDMDALRRFDASDHRSK